VRSGRTGRAGAAGTVVSLVTAEDSAQAASLQRDLGMAPARSEERRARGSRPGAPAAGGTRSRRRRRGSR